MDTQAYNSFASVGSDHGVVSAKVRLSLRAPKQKLEGKVKYVWTALEGDMELQDRYAVEVKNRFQMLDEKEDATARYERCVKAHEEAAQKVLTPVPKRKKSKLYSDVSRVAKARQEMEDAYTNFVAEGKQDGGATMLGRKSNSSRFMMRPWQKT